MEELLRDKEKEIPDYPRHGLFPLSENRFIAHPANNSNMPSRAPRHRNIRYSSLKESLDQNENKFNH